MKYTKAEVGRAREGLARLLKSGDTVYTVLRSVSRSGMFRRIDLYTIDDSPRMRELNDGKPRLRRISGYAAVLMGRPLPGSGNRSGIGIKGCGMDMGFALVDDLRAAFFGWEKTDTGHRVKGELRQEWI